MNFLDATLAFMEDAADIVLKAPECDDDGIGRSATPVPSRTRECQDVESVARAAGSRTH
jgi:hypothetical protein